MANFARLEEVRLAYGNRVVLDGLSLDIVAGAITCVIGLSGSGKSTLLRLINGLRHPQAGRVIVGDRDVAHLRGAELMDFRRHIGFSFQFSALFDSLTIGENVALPLREHTDLPDQQIRERVTATLASVGLPDVYDRFPSELSGGMVKRAGFARAVINEPDCVLYDEPTTGLDPIITGILTDVIIELRSRLGGTAVVVSHDLGSVYRMADYVAMLYDGVIVFYGTVDELRSSSNAIVRQFLTGSSSGPIAI
jgi:phospholipid/cholesterol/gamma-HCH transport system ATP-binding protein